MFNNSKFIKGFTFPRSSWIMNHAKFSLSISGSPVVNVVEKEEKKIAFVIMQRTPVNSLNLELVQEISSAIKYLEKKRYKGFILGSSSATVFSAGLDINELYQSKEERLRQFLTCLMTMWKTLYATPLITIAAINGHAPAGGCLLSISCDHSIMVKPKATIGLNETLLGLVAPKWLRFIFINTIGFQQAERSLKLGTLFTAEEALKLNLVDDLVASPAELMTRAEEEMDKWLKIPDAARKLTKVSLRKPHVDELISYEKQEVEELVQLINREETQNKLEKYFESLKKKNNRDE